MQIDQVSSDVIRVALYLDSKMPGFVSELWVDEDLTKTLRASVPSDNEIKKVISNTYDEINNLPKSRRSTYLTAILNSLAYQIINFGKIISYAEFTKNAFGFEIVRVTEEEIKNIVRKLSDLENITGLNRQETCLKYSLLPSEYQKTFEEYVTKAKGILPSIILNFPDKGFEFEVITGKPWSAFNSHTAPFRSRLTLNSDVSFTKLDLWRLAFHEAYGGHHSELSNKDLLLTNEGRGEHGLVITFSPQTFVSEAIAESIFVFLSGLDHGDNDALVGWCYDRLTFALHNLSTYMFFDDHLTREQIDTKLQAYPISDKTRENILNFSTDPLFGKYAPVYYTAYNFLENLYTKTSKKDELIKTLFTEPCTVELLTKEFNT